MAKYKRFAGKYSPDTQYEAGDIVSFDGAAYYRKVPGKGVSPLTNAKFTVWSRLSDDLSTVLGLDGLGGGVSREEFDRLSEEIADLKQTTETITKTGEVVSFDAEEGKEIKVEGSTTETVTLVHQGKNFLPAIKNQNGTPSGITYTRLEDGRVHVKGTATSTIWLDISTSASPFFLPAGEYVMTLLGASGLNVKLILHDVAAGKTLASIGTEATSIAFTTDTGVNVQSFIQISTGVTIDSILSAQVETGAVATDYEKCVRVENSVTLPTALSAFKGTNIIYTTGGDVLDASIEMEKKGGIDEDAVNALIDKATKFNPEQYGMPILHLTGDTEGMNKDDAVTLNFVYGERSGTCSVKWQGSSSLSYPKKNYTIKFDNAFEAKEGWGEQKKYCFKANFIDHSHARNLMCATLWGKITKSREGVDQRLTALPNAGAVDGFPCIIMLNGEFHGLYTWNIPKDGWMLGMGDGERECILCAEGKNADGEEAFKSQATAFGEGHGFELEYITDENDTGWALESLNRMISAVMNSDGTDLDTTVAQYLDWDSVIDHYIQTVMTGAQDCTIKNYLLCTFDGVKWFITGYDMDSTFGITWNGKGFLQAYAPPTADSYASMHKAMELVKTYKKDELKARYQYLRQKHLSESDVFTLFANFIAGIPEEVYAEDRKLWTSVPSTSVSNIWQIVEWYRMRVDYADKWFDAL